MGLMLMKMLMKMVYFDSSKENNLFDDKWIDLLI